jgi:hypothetical protein
MALGRAKTPAPIMAVTLWKVEYRQSALRSEAIGSHPSMSTGP